MGITVVSYTLKDIRDDENYLKSLGMARTAQVKKDARIGEALAHRDSAIRVRPGLELNSYFFLNSELDGWQISGGSGRGATNGFEDRQ